MKLINNLIENYISNLISIKYELIIYPSDFNMFINVADSYPLVSLEALEQE